MPRKLPCTSQCDIKLFDYPAGTKCEHRQTCAADHFQLNSGEGGLTRSIADAHERSRCHDHHAMYTGAGAVLLGGEVREVRTGKPCPVRRLVTAETATTGKAYHRRIGPAAASQVPPGLPSCSALKTLQARAALRPDESMQGVQGAAYAGSIKVLTLCEAARPTSRGPADRLRRMVGQGSSLLPAGCWRLGGRVEQALDHSSRLHIPALNMLHNKACLLQPSGLDVIPPQPSEVSEVLDAGT